MAGTKMIFVKRHELVIFFALAYLIAWATYFAETIAPGTSLAPCRRRTCAWLRRLPHRLCQGPHAPDQTPHEHRGSQRIPSGDQESAVAGEIFHHQWRAGNRETGE
jgi:hypothetical protein